jgi:hypothetical protein
MLKKILIISVLTIIGCSLLIAQPPFEYSCKKYEKGIVLYLIARDYYQLAKNYEHSKSNLLNRLHEDSLQAALYYQLAVNYAYLHNKDSMFFYLNKYVDYSEDDRVIFLDTAFIPYSFSSEWTHLVTSIENAYLQTLPKTINREYALDIFYLSIQHVKLKDLFLQENMSDSCNQQMNILDNAINDLINQYGFPTVTNTGKFGVKTMYEMINKVYISHRMYKYYKKDYHINKLASTMYAILTDQWLLQHHKKQKYGTQICPIFDNNGNIIRYIACSYSKYKEDDLFEIRKKMGFSEPINTYLDIINETINKH